MGDSQRELQRLVVRHRVVPRRRWRLGREVQREHLSGRRRTEVPLGHLVRPFRVCKLIHARRLLDEHHS